MSADLADLAYLVTRLEQYRANPFCWDARTDSREQRHWRRECEGIAALSLRAVNRPGDRLPRTTDVHMLRCRIEADPGFADGPMMIACLGAARDLIDALTARDEASREATRPAALDLGLLRSLNPAGELLGAVARVDESSAQPDELWRRDMTLADAQVDRIDGDRSVDAVEAEEPIAGEMQERRL